MPSVSPRSRPGQSRRAFSGSSARTDGALALALPGVPARTERARATGADVGFDGHLARFYDRLPYTVTVAPRKAFYLRQHVARESAVRWDEIAPDPAGWVTSLRVDVDRPDAGMAWMDAGLPQPTFIVRHRETGRAHLIYSLAHWVRRDNPRAMRLLERVQEAYRVALGGDAGYTRAMHHNPLCSAYSTIVGPQADYEIKDLALYVGEAIFQPQIRAWSNAAVRDDVAAAGRNCNAFEHVRVQAYRDVGRFRAIGDVDAWGSHVLTLAEAVNATHETPLPLRELAGVAKSIASWTWHVYRHGPKAAAERRQRYEQTRDAYLAAVDERRSEARKLRAQGLTLQAIATTMRVSRRTVSNYLAVEISVASESVQSALAIRTCAQGAEVGAAASADVETGQEHEITATVRAAVTCDDSAAVAGRREHVTTPNVGVSMRGCSGVAGTRSASPSPPPNVGPAALPGGLRCRSP